jgi:hypothetical protein
VSIDLLLLVLAAVCFAAAAVNVKFGDVQLVPLGLFFWVLAALL